MLAHIFGLMVGALAIASSYIIQRVNRWSERKWPSNAAH